MSKKHRILLALCAGVVVTASGALGAPITILHTFTSGATDGRAPSGLLLDGAVLYGNTQRGGLPDAGTVYRLNTDGTGFQLLHSFSGIAVDGQNPRGNLAIDGTTLYGTTVAFGGRVYKIETNGSGFGTLHTFAYPGVNTTAQFPGTGVTLSGSTLYGTTIAGGANAGPQIVANQAGNGGTVFSLGVNGTGYTPLHEFDPTTNDGWAVHTELIVSGQVIYGMTKGANPISPNAGTLFKVNTDGSGFQTLYEFSNTNVIRPDGAFPQENSLVLIGNRLYGATTSGGYELGGGFNSGVLFGIDTDGSNFDVLHTFGDTNDGVGPTGTLAFDGTNLYGVTQTGGVHGLGTLYQIKPDGTAYTKLHDFAGGPNDGSTPVQAGLIVDGNRVYGTTLRGGRFDIGVVYTLAIPEPSSLSCLALIGVVFLKRA